MEHTRFVDADGFTYLQHVAMAEAWCRWNGQKGTAKQAQRVKAHMTSGALARLLSDRGVVVLGVDVVAL